MTAGEEPELGSGSRAGAEARRFSIRARALSFLHAFSGIATLLRGEHNAWIHAAATLTALGLGFGSGITRGEWLAVSLAIALVWTAEAFNTAIEMLCDHVSPDFHPTIKQIKDMSAAAVLLGALGALAVGLLVFGPRLMSVLG